jgi:hypothetical protein
MWAETVHVCSHGLISTRFPRVVLAHSKPPQYLGLIPHKSRPRLPRSAQSAFRGWRGLHPLFENLPLTHVTCESTRYESTKTPSS